MQLEQHLSNYIWVMNNFIVYYSVTYTRGLTVYHTTESENNFYDNYSFILLPHITPAIYVNKIVKFQGVVNY